MGKEIGYLGEVVSVEFQLLKARLCVILHGSDNKTTTQKQLETTTFNPVFKTTLAVYETKNRESFLILAGFLFAGFLQY